MDDRRERRIVTFPSGVAVGVSSRLTGWLMHSRAVADKLLVVEEFPKSGGTWLARMLSSLTNWPFLDQYVLPPGGHAVLRVHAAVPETVSKCVYMVRDPRDVFVSLFHHRVAHWASNRHYRERWMAGHDGPLDPTRIREQFADFLGFEHDTAGLRGSGSPVTWDQHVQRHLNGYDGHGGPLVRYEDLRTNGAATLARVHDELFGRPVDQRLAEAVYKSHELELRRASDADASFSKSRVRAGEIGGWRAVLDRSTARLLDEQYGTTMTAIGYRDDTDWWKAQDD